MYKEDYVSELSFKISSCIEMSTWFIHLDLIFKLSNGYTLNKNFEILKQYLIIKIQEIIMFYK